MVADSDATPGGAARAIGDEPSLRLLQELVAIAPTNLEDLAQNRYEKPNYRRAADAIVRAARARGLSTVLYDPLADPTAEGEFHNVPRPNVVVDLDRGAKETVLILAHFDVVPIPAEQRARWASPPHALTHRRDGRLYGRGSNDDLGSGIVASLLALGRLAEDDALPRNVRLLACCDEETGGVGGIEALLAHDAALPPGDPGRFVRGDVALIPDGSPHTTAGSSGVAFLEASFSGPVPLREAVAYGQVLVGLDALARGWRSTFASPDWPDRGAPEPVITGRASVTRFDVRVAGPAGPSVRLLAAHAESDAANQIARAVTLLFDGPAPKLAGLPEQLRSQVAAPFRLEPAGATSLEPPSGSLALQLIGEAAHGGYPHRGHNPVPAALRLLEGAMRERWIDPASSSRTTFTIDLRLPPEMELGAGLNAALADVRARGSGVSPSSELVAPPERGRPGYALSPSHPVAKKLESIVRETLGGKGILGEYGGTDASSLRGVRAPDGSPIPALVFGSMDTAANIHDAEESVDPRLLAGVARTIERFVREP
jgi:acetylornithine deacetylase/succinyl-diaminopimelate desuccinylase-like protein